MLVWLRGLALEDDGRGGHRGVILARLLRGANVTKIEDVTLREQSTMGNVSSESVGDTARWALIDIAQCVRFWTSVLLFVPVILATVYYHRPLLRLQAMWRSQPQIA